MKTQKFLMNLLGVVLILISLFPLGLFIVSLQGDMEGSTVASIVGGLLFIGILALSRLCFRASHHIVIKYYSKLYSNVDRVVITNADSRLSAVSMPVGSFMATNGRVESILNMIIHFKGGSVSTRRVKVNSAEYRCLARYI